MLEDAAVSASPPAPKQSRDESRRPSRYPYRFFATCAKGTEGPLRTELVELGMHAPTGDRGGVWFEGTLEDAMRVCLHARVAVRVLLQIGGFEVHGPDNLYDGGRAIGWDAWLGVEQTFAVRANIRDSAITHSGYAALKLKDAIVDALRDKLGARPNVDAHDPDVGIQLHLRGTAARVFVDLAGEPLHRRGYRVAMTDAPLKETLAAAVLRLGRVPAEVPFLDPMAGSGTLAIEHALASRRMAPGLGRRFGFERWPRFDDAVRKGWEEQKEAARAQILPHAPAPIVCTEVLGSALDAARANAVRAGVVDDLEFQLADIRDGLARSWPSATLCSNPPYGERLGAEGAMPEPRAPAPAHREARAVPPSGGASESEMRAPLSGGIIRRRARQADPRPAPHAPRDAAAALRQLYDSMGRSVSRLSGWRVVLLCGNPELAEAIRLAPQISHRLFNGDLEIRLLCYEIRA